MELMSMKVDKSLKRLTLIELAVPVTLLIVGILAGLMQVLFRAGMIQANDLGGIEYYQALTLHGVVNAIVFTTFFAIAFGNTLVSYALNMKLNMKYAWLSAIVMLIGTVTAAIAILAGKASVLYTFYPPLQAHPSFYIGVVLLVVGSWIGFWNWIPMYVRWRKANPGTKTPMAVVGIFTTFIVWQIATLPVAYEVLVLLLPWSLGWTDTVNIMLARTLFWFFGHPLVYFWLLPAYVMYYTMLPRLAGGKLFSDMAGRMVFMMFIVFSIPVGTHHQFMEPGIGSQWKLVHAFFTFAVAIPSLVTAFTMAASLEYAGRKNGATGLFGWVKKLPYFDEKRWLFPYLLVGLVIFIFGGISGIINSSYNLNIIVHNTSWMPGHFHMTVAGPVFLAFIGMSLFLVEKVGGKELQMKKLAMLVPYIWMVGLFLFSSGLMRGGLHGEPRRTNMGLTYLNPDSPMFRPEWKIYVLLTAIGGIIMTIAMLVYFVVFFRTLLSRQVREEVLEFPLSEAYHNEPAGVFANFKPWIVAASVLIIATYIPVFYDVARTTAFGAPAYDPAIPMSLKELKAAEEAADEPAEEQSSEEAQGEATDTEVEQQTEAGSTTDSTGN